MIFSVIGKPCAEFTSSLVPARGIADKTLHQCMLLAGPAAVLINACCRVTVLRMKRNLDILPRYALPELTRFVVSLFSATGMDAGKAEAIADSLITSDSIGHSTNGLALAAPGIWKLRKAASCASPVTYAWSQ